jgi:hypothetical protein
LEERLRLIACAVGFKGPLIAGGEGSDLAQGFPRKPNTFGGNLPPF